MRSRTPKPERQTLGAGAARTQLATYPQSPLSGPARCCDVTDLYQAFRAAHRPGAIMDKSERRFVACLGPVGPRKGPISERKKPQRFSPSHLKQKKKRTLLPTMLP